MRPTVIIVYHMGVGVNRCYCWSHDMGGFEQSASVDVHKRWCAFGLPSSHSRLHGANSYRAPWLFDDEAVDVLRFITQPSPSLHPAQVPAHALLSFRSQCKAHPSLGACCCAG